MDKKMWLLIGVVALIVTIVGFGVSRLVSQEVVGGHATKLDCQNYLKNSYCNGLYSCTDCSLVALNGYSVVIGGKSYSSVWKADCVMGIASGYTFCGATTPTKIPNKIVSCWSSKSLCKDTVQGDMGSVECRDVVSCPSGCVVGTTGTGDYCNEGAITPVVELCSNKCNGVNEIKCSGSGYVKCQRGTNGCLGWGTSLSYCASGTVCIAGKCVAPAVIPPPVIPPVVDVCDTSRVCTSSSTYDRTYSDCSVVEKVCASGTKCESGVCVTIPPSPIEVGDLCVGVECDDYCTADYTLNSDGSCAMGTGKCSYKSITTNSEICLPKPKGNETEVEVPIRDDTTPTWFEKYGVIIAGVLLAVLIFAYIRMQNNEKGKGKKRR
jgi:hypothetical protein